MSNHAHRMARPLAAISTGVPLTTPLSEPMHGSQGLSKQRRRGLSRGEQTLVCIPRLEMFTSAESAVVDDEYFR